MTSSSRTPLILAALAGAMAVAAGAFGAHAAASEAAKGWLQTGGHYQLIHAVAVFAAAYIEGRGGGRAARIAAWLFLAGGLVFAGSLYLMAAGGPRMLGAITPLGGLALIGGWLTLAYGAVKARA